jgi:hypothetical protein
MPISTTSPLMMTFEDVGRRAWQHSAGALTPIVLRHFAVY